MTERHNNLFACLSPLLRIKKLMEHVPEVFLKAWHIALSFTHESQMCFLVHTCVFVCPPCTNACGCVKGLKLISQSHHKCVSNDLATFANICQNCGTWYNLQTESLCVNSTFQEMNARCMCLDDVYSRKTQLGTQRSEEQFSQLSRAVGSKKAHSLPRSWIHYQCQCNMQILLKET